MSTDILREKLNGLSENYFKIFSVNIKNPETLAEFVKRIRFERGLSITEVEKKSRVGGAKGISNGYVSQIENNYITNVSPTKLKALAKGLGITEEEIFAAARGTSPKSINVAEERFTFIAHGYADLSDSEKESIEPLLSAIENVIEKSGIKRTKDAIPTITFDEIKEKRNSARGMAHKKD